MSKFKPASPEELARRGLSPDGSPLKTTLVRARNENGTLKADDPTTPHVNEAYIWADRPVKKKRGRSPKAKE